MNPRVVQVVPCENYTLKLLFTNSEQGLYSCAGLLRLGVFQELADKQYFKQAAVEGGAVVWPHEQDICPDTLYLDSERVLSAFTRLLL